MNIDKFGQVILNENDLCDFYYKNPTSCIKFALTETNITNTLGLENFPLLKQYENLDITIEEFDKNNQNTYKMPNSYKELDIAEFILKQCKNNQELQRAAEELFLFQEKDMFDLLRYLKYLVDIMRENNILYGVGRGSSVASFVLFLLGVHRINSLYYDLPIEEFIKY
jgi:DNA polymerase III alpha subunit